MRKISVIGLGVNLLLVSMAWAADLPSRKDPGCNCRLHAQTPGVAVNDGAGWTPVVERQAALQAPEGKLVAANDAGLSNASYGPGWHAHFEPALPALREGDLVNVKQGGQAHLSWPDGTSLDLPQGVTRIDVSLCKAKTAPVVAAFPAATALVGLAAAGAIAGGVIAGTSHPNPPPFVQLPHSP